jgi:transmembrane sensor
MKYLGYSVEDFIADESFINYVNYSNEADVELWKKMIATYPQLEGNVAAAKDLYRQLSLKRSDAERLGELDRLILSLPKEDKKVFEEPKASSYPKLWFAMAAVVLVFFGIYLTVLKSGSSQEMMAYQADADDYRIFAETSLGERKTVTLPDGSTVMLNGSSILSISKSYNENNRALKLNGEAFFEVTKDKHKPFIVIADKTITTALGTSFKINNYPREQDISVMLATGKVSVKEVAQNDITKESFLSPGEQLQVFDYKQSVKSEFDELAIKNWKEKNLNFSIANINEIKHKLYDMYGVSIITNNVPSKGNQVFTGSFSGESLINVLEAISFVNHFKYEIKGNNVFITYQ